MAQLSESERKSTLEMLENAVLPSGSELSQRFRDGECAASICGWHDQGLNTLRGIGERLLEEGRCEDAVDLFLVLTAMAPQNGPLWSLLGNAEQACGRFEAALEGYGLAIAADAEDPLPHIFSAQCYGESGELKDEIRSLMLAYGLCEEHKRDTYLKKELEEAIGDLVTQLQTQDAAAADPRVSH